ncbi:MAG TPA: SDR family NAD(P)-dependent oxidoreductase, partial [Polyangiales bacterium]
MAKVMIVTGASRGIGAATARLAAASGYRVVVNFAHDGGAAQAVVESIAADGGEVTALQADVSREDEVRRLFERADAVFGAPAVLVNNAGVVDVKARVDQMDAAR